MLRKLHQTWRDMNAPGKTFVYFSDEPITDKTVWSPIPAEIMAQLDERERQRVADYKKQIDDVDQAYRREVNDAAKEYDRRNAEVWSAQRRAVDDAADARQKGRGDA